jgi:DNA polymerase-3 subunit epsilon
MDRVIDTLAMARRKHPGSPASLDALCSRYRIDNSRRVKHGALLDAELLAEVYAELSGGRQSALVLASEIKVAQQVEAVEVRPRPQPLSPLIIAEEENAHRSFIGKMGEKAVWLKYTGAPES